MNLDHTKLDACAQRMGSIRSRMDAFEESAHPRGAGGMFSHEAKKASESANAHSQNAKEKGTMNSHAEARDAHRYASDVHHGAAVFHGLQGNVKQMAHHNQNWQAHAESSERHKDEASKLLDK